MGALLEDLLNLSRFGRQAVKQRTIRLNELVQEVIDDLAIFRFAVPLKHPEQSVGEFHIEAGSVIPHEEHHLAIQLFLTHLDDGGVAWTCELDRV